MAEPPRRTWLSPYKNKFTELFDAPPLPVGTQIYTLPSAESASSARSMSVLMRLAEQGKVADGAKNLDPEITSLTVTGNVYDHSCGYASQHFPGSITSAGSPSVSQNRHRKSAESSYVQELCQWQWRRIQRRTEPRGRTWEEGCHQRDFKAKGNQGQH